MSRDGSRKEVNAVSAGGAASSANLNGSSAVRRRKFKSASSPHRGGVGLESVDGGMTSGSTIPEESDRERGSKEATVRRWVEYAHF